MPEAKLLENPTDEDHATFDCPICGLHGVLDKDQYEGKVSVQCPNCDFHETIDFRSGGVN